ncbi:MAG: hypothetical protein AAF658_12850, partial [Myxococcota bacterium]
HNALDSIRLEALKAALDRYIEYSKPNPFPGEKYFFFALTLVFGGAASWVISKAELATAEEVQSIIALLAVLLLQIATFHWTFLRAHLDFPTRADDRRLAMLLARRLDEVQANLEEPTTEATHRKAA